MHLNPFVYSLSKTEGIADPDIDVHLREHYGQLAEDLIVDGLLTAWSARTGVDLSTRRYLEIGGNHPFATSASFLLHRLHGMKGVLVEANEKLIGALQLARPHDIVEYCAITASDAETVEFYISNQSEVSSLSKRFVEEWQDGEVGLACVRTVPAKRANELLGAHFSQESPVFLAIDTEGSDLQIMQDIDWTRWRPVVLQAEPSDRFSPGTEESMVQFMQQNDYILAARTDVNLIFMDREALQTQKVSGDLRAGGSEQEAPFVSPRTRYGETCSVGIVTRTKERAVLLRRTLESVKNQTYPYWRLVVVNDGGEPNPVDELVGAVFQGDERVRVIHHIKSKGMEAASNAGLALLDTDLAAIHDDDDSWAPDMLAVATKVLRDQNSRLPSIRGVVTLVNWVDETVTGNHIKINHIRPWLENDRDSLSEGLIDLSRLAVKNLFPPISFIFDLSVSRQIGAFDSSLPVLGDWDFNLRFCLKHDVWVHPELLAFYHIRHSASGALGNTVIAGKSKHMIYNKYLRNRWLREAAKDQAGHIMLHGQSTKLDYIEELLKHSNPIATWALKNKKQKTGIAALLSKLNRKRKALRRKRS